MISKTILSNILQRKPMTKFNQVITNKSISTSKCHRQVFSISSKEEFEKKVVTAGKPVIVYFYGDRCDICKIFTPRIKESVEHLGKVDLAIMDLDLFPKLANKYGVSDVPAVLTINNGIVADKHVGLMDIDMLKTYLEKFYD